MRVGKHLFGQGDIQSHEQGRPVDAVEAHDVLADDLKVSRPGGRGRTPKGRGWEAGGGEVVDQSIDPDINSL